MKEIDNKSESLKLKFVNWFLSKGHKNCGSKETCKDVASRKCYSKKTFK